MSRLGRAPPHWALQESLSGSLLSTCVSSSAILGALGNLSSQSSTHTTLWKAKPSLPSSCVQHCFILSLPPAKSLQWCPTLCGPVDSNPPGSSVHGILWARKLEWVATPSSRGSSQPRDWIHASYVSCSGRWVLYHKRHLGSPSTSESESICS